MGRFLMFVGALILLSIAGLAVWWIYSKISINIQRRNSVFEIEKEVHKKAKNEIQEEERE